VHNNLGYTYLLKTDYLKAISEFGSAISIEPANEHAFGNLSLAYGHLGGADKAQAATTPAAPQAPVQTAQAEPAAPVAPVAPVTEAAPAAQLAETAQAAPTEPAPQAAQEAAPTEAPQVAQAEPATTAAAPAGEERPSLTGLTIEISNGTRDQQLGESLATALRQEGVTVTRVAAMKPYTQRRNVILYRDGYYKQAQALSRSFTIPPALVNNTHSRDRSDESNIRLVLGKSALQTPDVASNGKTDPAF
jgi:tetratricopeptide (TPR) repeat protein